MSIQGELIVQPLKKDVMEKAIFIYPDDSGAIWLEQEEQKIWIRDKETAKNVMAALGEIIS
ncbi:MAG: hypothetical protein ACI4PV_02895 [Butyricicoccus sp.]